MKTKELKRKNFEQRTRESVIKCETRVGKKKEVLHEERKYENGSLRKIFFRAKRFFEMELRKVCFGLLAVKRFRKYQSWNYFQVSSCLDTNTHVFSPVESGKLIWIFFNTSGFRFSLVGLETSSQMYCLQFFFPVKPFFHNSQLRNFSVTLKQVFSEFKWEKLMNI